MTMGNRFMLLISVLLGYWGLRYITEPLRIRTVNIHEFVKTFPGAVTLGFYSCILVSYAAAFLIHAAIRRSFVTLVSKHSLLFLMVCAFCGDYVLNNYLETKPEKHASYGLVILLDFVIWTCAALVMAKYAPQERDDYEETPIVLWFPTLALLREALQTTTVVHKGPAFVDLIVQALFIFSWVLLPYRQRDQEHYRRTTMAAKFLLLCSLVYFFLLISENMVSHFLSIGVDRNPLADFPLGEFGVNVAFAIIAILVGAILFAWNPRNLRYVFGGQCSTMAPPLVSSAKAADQGPI